VKFSRSIWLGFFCIEYPLTLFQYAMQAITFAYRKSCCTPPLYIYIYTHTYKYNDNNVRHKRTPTAGLTASQESHKYVRDKLDPSGCKNLNYTPHTDVDNDYNNNDNTYERIKFVQSAATFDFIILYTDWCGDTVTIVMYIYTSTLTGWREAARVYLGSIEIVGLRTS